MLFFNMLRYTFVPFFWTFRAVDSITSTVFFPLVPWLFQILITLFATCVGVLLLTNGTPIYEVRGLDYKCKCDGPAANYWVGTLKIIEKINWSQIHWIIFCRMEDPVFQKYLNNFAKSQWLEKHANRLNAASRAWKTKLSTTIFM